jgi:uncharacterized protein YndB with AHSA1/START domain
MTPTATVHISTPTERDVVITREFHAARPLVFDALTQPELLKRWYGQSGWSLVVCASDLRVGGEFRYVSRKPNGKEVGQRGVYHEIARPERIAYSEWWEDWDAGETRVTTVLVEHRGKTTLTTTATFPSREVRDIVLKSGLESSAGELYDRLAEVLSSMKPG